MPLPKDTLLQGGRYRIVRYLASGGFGCTYEGVHTGLDKRVAIKEFFVKDICNRDENTAQISVGVTSKAALFNKLRKKFVDEARALCKLDHPNIVKVSDVFDENGTSYFVMDYIDGQSLKDMVYSQGPLPESVAVNYVLQIADALGCVHDNNRLHLDVKPGNIMINSKGQAQLIDFGASKQYEEESGENTSSVAGYTIGYAPTEQMGNDIRRFTPATDVYSLGATLYNLLSGIKPISAAIISSGEQQQPLPPYVSASTRNAVEKAMLLNKTLRPQSMAEFASMLVAVDVKIEENGDTTVRAGQEPVEVEIVVETEKKAPAVVEKPSVVPQQNKEQKIVDYQEPTYKEPEESKSYGKILGVLGVIVVLAFIVGYFALPKQTSQTKQQQASQPKQQKQQAAKPKQQQATPKPKQPSVSSPSGFEDGYGYVDLGLSVKWATMNVGANKPSGYGGYYAWGETKTKSAYDWKTYFDTNDDGDSFFKYALNKKTTLDLSDDAAHANWGGSWRMPTRAEQDELREKCSWTWTTLNGVKGYKVSSKRNSNSIFLPAAGWRDEGSLSGAGSSGNYWSSSLYTSVSYDAFYLDFDSDDVGWYDSRRGDGQSVRAVCP